MSRVTARRQPALPATTLGASTLRPPVPTPPSFEEFLAQQRADYRASLPARLAALQAAWAGLDTAESPPQAQRVALERCAHGLAGSAATFGLPDLGDAARALENWLESAPASWDAQARATARDHVQALHALLRRAIDG